MISSFRFVLRSHVTCAMNCSKCQTIIFLDVTTKTYFWIWFSFINWVKVWSPIFSSVIANFINPILSSNWTYSTICITWKMKHSIFILIGLIDPLRSNWKTVVIKSNTKVPLLCSCNMQTISHFITVQIISKITTFNTRWISFQRILLVKFSHFSSSCTL